MGNRSGQQHQRAFDRGHALTSASWHGAPGDQAAVTAPSPIVDTDMQIDRDRPGPDLVYPADGATFSLAAMADLRQ